MNPHGPARSGGYEGPIVYSPRTRRKRAVCEGDVDGENGMLLQRRGIRQVRHSEVDGCGVMLCVLSLLGKYEIDASGPAIARTELGTMTTAVETALAG